MEAPIAAPYEAVLQIIFFLDFIPFRTIHGLLRLVVQIAYLLFLPASQFNSERRSGLLRFMQEFWRAGTASFFV